MIKHIYIYVYTHTHIYIHTYVQHKLESKVLSEWL